MSEFRLTQQDNSDLTRFLRELVQTPSPSTHEGAVAQRVAAEMTRLGFTDVRVDRIGNVIARVGAGPGPLLMLNGHMDTVQVSDPDCWSHAPFGAEIDDGAVYGVGACDMKGGLAAMVYGAKLLLDSGVALHGSLVVAAVVQEEPTEGLGSRVLIEEEGVRPDWVVLAEPSSLNISRGHRGRVEMRLVVHGRAAHAACPHLGDNAIYRASRLVFGLEMLADQAGSDDFLGPGSLAVTYIASSAGSHNAVPDRCELIIDRRLTLGESEVKSLSEVQRVLAREGIQADLAVSECSGASYTGYAYHTRLSYPAWVIAEDHPLITAASHAVKAQLRHRPQVTRYDFSTEGVYTAGVAGIPTIGLGPGDPRLAHTADEHVKLADVAAAAEIYAQIAWELLGKRT
ncbi:MAG: YgeY family selenium metabolism-linked hydrolase [Anaerolineales bacterium]|nr:YgeY family selenium metabolism-linked hydrolase [Anaerolineales bacterium]